MSLFEGRVPRRSVLQACGAACFLLASAGTVKASDATVRLDNEGTTAWTVSEDSEGLIDTGSENPDIVLEQGKRYEFTNEGWSDHRFQILDENGAVLLSQDGDGGFHDDGGVQWQDTGDAFEFTVTQELASHLHVYHCTRHSSMNGEIMTAEEADERREEEEDDEVEDEDEPQSQEPEIEELEQPEETEEQPDESEEEPTHDPDQEEPDTELEEPDSEQEEPDTDQEEPEHYQEEATEEPEQEEPHQEDTEDDDSVRPMEEEPTQDEPEDNDDLGEDTTVDVSEEDPDEGEAASEDGETSPQESYTESEEDDRAPEQTEEEDEEDPDDEETSDTDDEGPGDDTLSNDDGDTAEDLPGFGFIGTAAAIASGYIIKRQKEDTQGTE